MTFSNSIFDRAILRKRRERCARYFHEVDYLKQKGLLSIAERLEEVQSNEKGCLLDFACHNRRLSDSYPNLVKDFKIFACDHAFSMIQSLDHKAGLVVADEELVPFQDGSMDIILSALSLHLVNDLPGVLIQLCRILKKNGVFLASLIGGGSLSELRHCFMEVEQRYQKGGPRIIPLIDIKSMGMLMQRCGFKEPVISSQIVTIYYRDAMQLMMDLKKMGESNMLTKRPKSLITPRLLKEVVALYQARYAQDDGSVKATFELIDITAFAP